MEYFGNDRAWSDDSESVAPVDQMSAEPLPAGPTEVAPEDVSVHHLGHRAAIRWDDEHRYDLGTIVAVSADSSAISVKLAGLEKPVSFSREEPRRAANPRLYVWV